MKYGAGFLVLLLAFVFLPISLLAQKDDDVIDLDSSIVVLNASITDTAEKAVGGLSQKLFHIFEDGVEQKLASFSAEETPFAAVVLLDTSGSMEDRVALARAAAIEFIQRLRPTDSAAIYNFSSRVDLVQDFTNSHNIRDKIFDLKADGMTVLYDAVYKAAEVLSKRPEKRRAIIVLSDGADTMSRASDSKALKAALAVNAMVFTVDMSPPDAKPGEQKRGVLKSFAEKTGGRYVTTPGGMALRDAFTRIVEELGSQYTLAYQPTTTKRDGKWHSIELRVSRPNLTIRTRKGYNAPRK